MRVRSNHGTTRLLRAILNDHLLPEWMKGGISKPPRVLQSPALPPELCPQWGGSILHWYGILQLLTSAF